jgi:CubicO group peptidase (beta-lactamase class C family)
LLVTDASTWTKVGANPELYSWSFDPSTSAMLLTRNDTNPTRIGWAATHMEVDATGYAGKRIRFTAQVRTENVALGAAVWLRADDRRGPYTLCNLTGEHVDLRLKGTNDFTPLSCTLDIPLSTKRLIFGTNHAGAGRSWVRRGTLEEVGPDVAVNAAYTPDSVRELGLADDKGVDEAALERIVARTRSGNADALVVLKDGHVLLDHTFDKAAGRIETMSVTKAIVGLAIGKLFDQGKLTSLDAPLTTWFPQWSKDAHSKITLRMVLDHTSCLRSAPTTEEIYASKDWVELALAAELVCDPGSKSSYNNKAVNLLAPIVQAASGKRLDDYVRDEIFKPLGIADFKWSTDPAGHPQCMAGLELRPFDLAKIGQMMLDGGNWHGTSVISADWIKRATEDPQPNSTFGLLWWRVNEGDSRMSYDDAHIEALKQAHVSKAVLTKVETIRGKLFTRQEFRAELDKLFTPDEMKEIRKANDTIISKLGSDVAFVPGPQIGFQSNGWLGQYLVVIPRDHLVAVRMVHEYKGPEDKSSFTDFPSLVAKLVTH